MYIFSESESQILITLWELSLENDLFGDFDYFSEGAFFLIFCNWSLTTTAHPCPSSSGDWWNAGKTLWWMPGPLGCLRQTIILASWFDSRALEKPRSVEMKSLFWSWEICQTWSSGRPSHSVPQISRRSSPRADRALRVILGRFSSTLIVTLPALLNQWEWLVLLPGRRPRRDKPQYPLPSNSENHPWFHPLYRHWLSEGNILVDFPATPWKIRAVSGQKEPNRQTPREK